MAKATLQQPLATYLRPTKVAEFFGQSHLLAENKPLWQVINKGQIHSMIFWGPPGTGKTTLAHLIAKQVNTAFEELSAVLSGVKEIRAVVERAQKNLAEFGQKTILFVDEVHRFNKAQQDAFLPPVEAGDIILIGATTENPSFQLNNALLSRVRVYVLQSLTADELMQILDRSVSALNKIAVGFSVEHKRMLIHSADGDARKLLNMLEMLFDFLADDNEVTEQLLQQVLNNTTRRFDNQGEEFYNQISALHKSVRGSDPDAALYWLARIIDGGCDPAYLARRILRMATEDIGNADPRALTLCLDAWQAYERLGSPEGELALAQAVVYLACCPKSNAVYTAFSSAMSSVKQNGTLPVPLRLRNAPTKLMKELGYSEGYRYAHDEAGAFAAGETYFPDEMSPEQYYFPVARGLEIKIAEKLEKLRAENDKQRKN